jgi:hypothetical protein
MNGMRFSPATAAAMVTNEFMISPGPKVTAVCWANSSGPENSSTITDVG